MIKHHVLSKNLECAIGNPEHQIPGFSYSLRGEASFGERGADDEA
jgi:hypothetical protein